MHAAFMYIFDRHSHKYTSAMAKRKVDKSFALQTNNTANFTTLHDKHSLQVNPNGLTGRDGEFVAWYRKLLRVLQRTKYLK